MSMDTIVNLTPHDVVVCELTGEKRRHVFKSQGVARAAEEHQWSGQEEWIPVYSAAYGPVTGLPEPDGKTRYIVSNIVAQAMRGKRSDLLVPTLFIRDGNGAITGCQGFKII